MKLITRDTDYAIRALCFIAKQKNKIVCVPELVKGLKMPRPFLRKILQILNRKGFLRSHKGMGGGFQLNIEPADISVFDLMLVFQGPFKLNEHIFKSRACPYMKKCRLKKRIDRIERDVISELKGIMLAYLIRR